jgi:repressor LexA
MNKRDLTAKQDKILRFIEEFWGAYSLSPTYQEIQEHFGFESPNAAQKHVQALVKKGFIRGVRDSHGRNRSLVSVRGQRREVPLVGRIAAGVPIEAVENIAANFDFSSIGIDNAGGDFFALTVKGNSMIGAHVLDGDMVVVKKQNAVQAHDMAAVLVGSEATLKYVRKKGDVVELVPANDAMQPIVVDPEKTGTFEILGKVVRVIRTV